MRPGRNRLKLFRYSVKLAPTEIIILAQLPFFDLIVPVRIAIVCGLVGVLVLKPSKDKKTNNQSFQGTKVLKLRHTVFSMGFLCTSSFSDNGYFRDRLLALKFR